MIEDSEVRRYTTKAGKEFVLFRNRRKDEPTDQYITLKRAWQKAHKAGRLQCYDAPRKAAKAAYVKAYTAKRRLDPAVREKMRGYTVSYRQRMGPEMIRWRANKQHDKKVGREFTLPFSEFMRLVLLSCTYCGKAEAGGVDRLNSDIGHTTDNCVPCCYTCNQMKMDRTLEEFVLQIEAIHARFTLIAQAA